MKYNLSMLLMGGAVVAVVVVALLFLLPLVQRWLKTRTEGMETYAGPNGATAQQQDDGSFLITGPNGTALTFTETNASLATYEGPNGATAKIVTDQTGNKTLVVQDSSGTVTSYTVSASPSSPPPSSSPEDSSFDNYNHFTGTAYPTIYYGPNGGTARLIQTPHNKTIVVTSKSGTTTVYVAESPSATVYVGDNGGSAVITANGIEITTPDGSKIVYTGDNVYTYSHKDNTINQFEVGEPTQGSDYNTAFAQNSTTYYSSLPKGIPRSQIPPGEEDLYILKSEVVPPVCPKCPDPIVSTKDNSKCPPCPPCARCPEPAFDCVKRPNYSAFNPDYMPVPVMSDFSQFGM